MAEADAATIDEALDAFLAEHRERLSPTTARGHAAVVALLRSSLNGYAYSSLDADELAAWQQAFDGGDEHAFCRLFGPEKIPEHLGHFLGYFMVRKVMASRQLLKASGTVGAKLVRWLATHGHIDDDERAADAITRARDAARDLPDADRLAELLHHVAARSALLDTDAIADEDWIEDQLAISDVQPHALTFDGDIGPIDVPSAASTLARRGWMVSLTAARIRGRWQLLEVGCVYPS